MSLPVSDEVLFGLKVASSVNLKTAFLVAGWSGGAGGGQERGWIAASRDNKIWVQIHGLENYTPTSGQGIRDPGLTKIGSNYFICHTIETVSPGTIIGFITSPELVNWTHIADVSLPNGWVAPKWFKDPPTGNLYVTGYNNEPGIPYITQVTTLTTTSVTCGTPVPFTLAGGGNVPMENDPFLLWRDGTYYLFSNPSTTYHVYTSSSLTSGYVDQGAVTNWDSSQEALCITEDTSGNLYSISVPRSGPRASLTAYSTASDPSPGSWSAQNLFPGCASSLDTTTGAVDLFNNNFLPLLKLDNGGYFAYNDSDTARDVALAQVSSYNPSIDNYWQNTNSLPATNDNRPIMCDRTQSQHIITGVGTVSSSASTTSITGSGTLFTKQCTFGSEIAFSGVAGSAPIRSVNSDTSITTYQLVGPTSGVSYTILPPVYSGISNNGKFAITASGIFLSQTNHDLTEFTGSISSSNSAPNFWGWLATGDGNYQLSYLYGYGGGASPIVIDSNAADRSLHLTSDGISTTGIVASASVSVGTVIHQTHGYTVSTLPAGTIGDAAFVTDALTPTFGATLVGGGAVVAKAFYNGTNWINS